MGDQSDETSRSVAENKADETVGGPISDWMTADADALFYSSEW